MNRKYLDDINVTKRPDTWNEDDPRQAEWLKDREIYGFDERETWSLEYSWSLWLYERLKMYLDYAGVDLNYHTFEYKGTKYTQKQLIDMMIERLEFSFKPTYNDWDKEQWKYVHEVTEIWAVVIGAMWW